MTFDRTARESSLIMAASIVASFISPSQAHGQVLRLVSSPPVYHPVNHHGDRPSMSADGRYVAFASTNALVPDDVTDVYLDIYVKDLITNDVQRISVNSSGEAANNHSSRPCLSPDGRYIAFESLATNLVAGDTNNLPDIFIYDRQTGITERVSLSSNEAQSNGLSYEANLSEDGRFVAFTSEATNLDSSVASVGEQVYLRDRLLGTTEIISMDPDAPAMHQFTAFRPTMSYDGRYVAFTATTRYDLEDVNGLADVFLRDRQTGTLTRVSKGDVSLGLNGDGAFLQTISADGRFVAFHGTVGHIEGDTNGFGDIFVKDLNTNVIERVSVDSNGNQSIGGFSHDAVISANGRFVAFSSWATNLVPGDTNDFQDVFVHDRVTHTTVRVSISDDGVQGNADSGGSTGIHQIAISADGHLVAFTSGASNMVADDLNTSSDVFVALINRNPVAMCSAAATSGPGPTIGGMGQLIFEADNPGGRQIQLSGLGSTDPDNDPLLYHWDVSRLDVTLDDPNAATPTGMFPIGSTMATLTVVDQRGGVATCDVKIHVQDTTPPTVECTTNVAMLWPPKHAMHTVTVLVQATDSCGFPEGIFPLVVKVNSDEADDAPGNGDGATTGDVNGQSGAPTPVNISTLFTAGAQNGTWVATIQLRAERAGSGDGRCYTIDVIATDCVGNISTTSCCVVVPHDRQPASGS